ncbi:MAG: ABC transporter ATP-binding protein [Candidatus Coatesbacteria bacterium]|nr:ABC transporter ATP-binding protein [Candidatus Coatesbacteria bacterium]
MIQKLRVAFRLMWQHRALALKFFTAAAARALLLMLFLWMIRTFLTSAFGPSGQVGSEGDSMRLAGAGILIVLCWVGRSVADYFSSVLQTELGRRVEMRLRLTLVEHLLTLSLSFFNRTTKADILRAVNADAASLRLLVQHTGSLVISLLQVAGLLATAFMLDPVLTGWGLVALPLAVIPLTRIGSAIYRDAKEGRFQGITITNLLIQALSGIRIVKVFEGEKHEAQACHKSAMELLRVAMEVVRRQSLASVLLDSLSGFGIFFVIMLGGSRVSGGAMDVSSFIAFIIALQMLLGSTRQIVNIYSQVKIESVAIDKIDEFLAQKPDITDNDDAIELLAPPQTIQFENVSYSYDSEPVLANVSFSVRSGETIGIVGPSGVGKTTLLNLIPRFYDPTEGRITIDGIDIKRIKLKHLMRNLAIVTQEPFLFQVSIMENVRYGRPDATDEEVKSASKAAGIHDDIISWKDGYDTVIGPTRADVSVGQKQRINIARAILKNAPILLLDEATSALDSKTEVRVQESLDKLMEKCTTFVVAHRLSTLRKAHRILVLANGGIEAFASHEELLEKSRTYRQLWKAQQRGGDTPSEYPA